VKREYIMDLIKAECKLLGFNDIALIYAIIETESNWNPFAVRYEPHWKYIVPVSNTMLKKMGITRETEEQLQKFSWGLMQVMGAVARELNYSEILTKLITPQDNINVGVRKVIELFKKYKNLEDVIASYNAGSPRKVDGKYVNQSYVDKVLSAYRKYKEG